MATQTEKKESRNFRSLTVTLAVAFLALSSSVLMIAICLDIYFSFQTQREVITSMQQLIAREAANTAEGFIQEKFSVLEVSSTLGSLANEQRGEQKLILEKLLGAEPAFRKIVLLDTEKRELAKVSRMSGLPSFQFTNLSINDVFLQVGSEKEYIGPLYIDEVTGEPMVIMAVPVKNVFGDFDGVLIAEVNLKFLWDVVDTIKVGKSGVAYVVDRQGSLIAFGDISRVLKGEKLNRLEKVKDFMEDANQTARSEYDTTIGILGTDVVSSYVPLGMPDWAVVVELPVQEAYGPVFERIMISIWIMLLSIVMAITVGVYLARRITKPIIGLRNAAIKIGQGLLDTDIKITSKNEIGELASAFTQMTVDLRKSRAELEGYSKNLERQFTERTKDLQDKVQELTETKAAVLNMMEDMDEANRNLVQTHDELRGTMKELAETDVKKDQFISIAAHELKTPLTSIHGFSQLLQNRKISNNFTKRNKYLKIMDHETKRLGKLVSDILDLSRIDLGTVRIALSSVDLNSFMENIQKEMEIHIRGKNLKSEYDIEKHLPKIITDSEKLSEILINLINNAVKYSEKGKITVKAFVEDGHVHFIVKDTGIGIPENQYGKIFDRFYQIDSTYTRKVGGTGLGLSLCKEFVEILGGSIWVKSDVGKGSEFHFTMPFKSTLKENIRKVEKEGKEKLRKSEKLQEDMKKLGFGK